MFKEKTAIILGAGASSHLDFPTGEELIDKIKNLDCAKTEKKIICNKMTSLAEMLEEMQPLSIDMFLSYHPEFEKIGKECIAKVILECENKNMNCKDKDTNGKGEEKNCKGNWYKFLVDAIISQCKTPKDILTNKDNLSIVTFNYDLSLEWYLHSRLSKISFFKEHVVDFLKNINIIHVYGQLGCFDWHKNFCKKTYCNVAEPRGRNSYGQKDSFSEGLVKEYALGIEVIGAKKWNGDGKSKHIKKIQEKVSSAKNLYILGFGFYEENMELINLNKQKLQSGPTIFYTNFGDHQKIERQLLKRNKSHQDKLNRIKSTGTVYDALDKDFDFTT